MTAEVVSVSEAAPESMLLLRGLLTRLEADEAAEAACLLTAFSLWAAFAFGGGVTWVRPGGRVLRSPLGVPVDGARVTSYLAAFAFTYPAMSN